jgi:hypothetical protein
MAQVHDIEHLVPGNSEELSDVGLTCSCHCGRHGEYMPDTWAHPGRPMYSPYCSSQIAMTK